MRYVRRLGLILAIVGFGLPSAARPSGTVETRVADTERIVAIGDIHGALDELTALLQRTELVDASGAWIGGEAVLVQTGDYTDRGPSVRGVMDFLIDLEKRADEAGGRVEILLGNHEGFNLVGFLRDTTAADSEAFVDAESAERRLAALDAWKEFRIERAEHFGVPPPTFTDAVVESWLERHPPGFVERMEAFGPDGTYGEWLRERPAIVRIDDVLFLHGGVSPAVASWSPSQINGRLRDEIRVFDETKEWMVDAGLALPFFTLEELIREADAEVTFLETRFAPDRDVRMSRSERQALERLKQLLGINGWFLLHTDGPLWFRGYGEWTEEEGGPQVEEILDQQDVEHVVVGHTTQFDGSIVSRFGGRVFIIDTGMLSSYYQGGRPSALEIRDGRFTALYPDTEEVLLEPGDPPREAPRASTIEARIGSFAGPHPERAARGPAEPYRTAVRRASLRPPLGPVGESKPAGGQAAPEGPLPPAPTRTWLGPDDQPLPFESDDEILDFLRTAEIVSSQVLDTGITGARRVVLERDGVRMRAIFHDIDLESERRRIENRFFPVFRDSWTNQCAAYYLARLLGVHNVPPTVVRRVDNEKGSLQFWIEGPGVMTNTDRIRAAVQPPDVQRWLRASWNMAVFDNLVYNDDRNPGNVLIDSEWEVWLIDNTRAFQLLPELRNPEKVTHVSDALWERLRSVSDESIRQTLEPYLTFREINPLLERRRLLVELIEDMISERGRGAVIFTSESNPTVPSPAALQPLLGSILTRAL